jgi:hypothetical protein
VDVVSAPLAITLAVVGALVLGAAALVAAREPLERRRAPGGGMLQGLVPWIGSLLVVVLLVRGSLAGAAFVGVATLLHAGVTRALASRSPR